MKKYIIFLTLITNTAYSASLLDKYPGNEKHVRPQLNESSKFNNFLDKNFSGSIGTSYVDSNSGTRQSNFLQARIDYDNKYSRIVIDGQYIDSSIEMTQTDAITGNERNIEYSYSDPEFLETYVDLKLLSNLTLSTGLKKIVWGQFEPFSPIDFALPIYFSRNYVEYTKSKGRVPKENISLTYYPHPKIEISGYFFPEYEIDPIIEEINTGDNVEIPTGSDLYQSAGRIMFYPEFATFGFTYFNGFNHMQNSQGYYYHSGSTIKDPFLIENEMFGFEFAKQFDNYNLKFEYSISDQMTDLSTYTSNSNYLSWVQNDNNNKFYVDGKLHFGALGVKFARGLWNYDLMVYYYKVAYDDNAQIGVDYDEVITGDSNDGPTDIGNLLPSFNISRYASSKRNTKFGLAAGVLGVGQGVAIYANGNINESFEWLLATEYLEYFSNMMIDDANDDNNYESEDDLIFGVRASLQYKF